tara:strand:+ start:1375 stop:3780 length:2406 start_codon:yes stop_codon:yes gene_type:complete
MSSNKTFPRQKLSFKKKGQAWRKEHLDWADKNSFLGSESVRKKLRDKVINQNLYDGVLDMRDLKMILNPGEMEQHLIPNAIQHYPIITPRVNVLVGEEKRRKFDWSVSITNPDTLSSIKKDKKAMLDAKLNELLTDEEMSDEEAQKALADYAGYVNMDYQDIREKRANLLLRHYIGALDMKVKFQAGFKDALLGAEEMYMFDIVNSEVTFEKLNPHKVFTLRSGSSNKIEDADVIVIDDYWSPGKILDHYYEDLNGKEVDLLEGTTGTTSNGDADGENVQIDDIQGMKVLTEGKINAFLESSGVYWNGGRGKGQYTDADGNIRVLRMFWRSKKCIYKVSYFDEMGKQQVKYRSEEYILDKEMGETYEKFWVNQWWKGVKIGQEIYVQIKPREIQYNKFNQPSFNSCGIVGQVYNTNDGRAVSLVDRAKPFQYLYDISWYRVNEALSKYLGSIVELDIAKIPKDWSITKWLYFARKSGISVVDSFKEGQKGMAKGKLAGSVGNTTGKVLEQRVGDFIQTHIQMMDFAKAQMDEVTGVSRQRLGQTENRETVGGIERAVSQSNHITEELFTLHDYCKKRCFQILIETAKIALKGNTMKFNYIADDMTRQLMEIDGDEFAEEEYGIQVTNEDAINQMQQKLDGMVQMGLQNQMLSFSTAMKIYNSPSLREVQRMIEKDEASMKESQSKQAEDQNAQAQAQMQQQAMQAEQAANLDLQKFNREDETKRYIAELNAETIRITEDQKAAGAQSIDDDTEGLAKFEAELGIKNKALDQDMIKHNDSMSKKDKELAIKSKQANKAATNK